MKINAMFAMVLCIGSLVTSAAAFAADTAEFVTIGFSKDSKTFAYEQFGVQDGSGFPYSEIGFVDVAKNQQAKAPVRVVASSEASTVRVIRAEARKQAAASLSQLGIVAGENLGNVDFMVEGSASPVKPDSAPQIAQFKGADGADYKLTLKSKAAPTSGDPSFVGMYGKPALMSLRLSKTSGESKVLQEDSSLTGAGGYPMGYLINQVIQSTVEDKVNLVVVVSYVKPGFEGFDVRYKVVTSTQPVSSNRDSAKAQSVEPQKTERRFASPDGQLTAVIVDSEGESTVSILDASGKETSRINLTSADHRHGMAIEKSEWTPDSKFLVFTGSSSGGHSPWKVPAYTFDRVRSGFLKLEDALGEPVVDTNFALAAPDVMTVVVGRGEGFAASSSRKVELSKIAARTPTVSSR